jgi:hypothetical protein
VSMSEPVVETKVDRIKRVREATGATLKEAHATLESCGWNDRAAILLLRPVSRPMDLRDYSAGQALSGWIVALAQRRDEPGYDDDAAAHEAGRLALVTADAMLAERAKAEAPR